VAQQEEKQNVGTPIPELNEKPGKPQGVVPKQSQAYLLTALAIVILLAALFSNRRAKPATPAATPPWSAPAPPTETNEHAIQQLKKDLAEEQRKSLEKQNQKTSDAAEANDKAGKASASGGPHEATRDPIADAERALRFKSRFESNLVIASDTSSRAPANSVENIARPEQVRSEITQARSAGNQRAAEINLNAADGQPFAIFEGTTVDTVLVNRLDGDFSGPVKVMVTNPVYSQDRQHVLVAEGTFVLGEVERVSSLGQRRLAIRFHRMIMPDGYSVDLDQFHGLDSKGETGLTDQVNRHYFQIFGASIALGVIAGVAGATTTAGINESGADAVRQGVASSLAQSGTHVLDRFLNILPEITIREGHHIKVYITQDLLLPAYENHRIPGNI
jgi:type IV secretory pathway VirB10-like protein